MAQSFTFDPTSEDAANVPLELLSSTTKLFEHSYPAPPLEIQYAGSVDTEGSVPGSRKYANRVITLKIWCLTRAALELLQSKVAKIGRDGGTLKWVSSTGETIIFDLLAHDVFEPVFDLVYNARGVAQVSVSFVAKPFGRGAPITRSAHLEATLPVLVFSESALLGDVPPLGQLEISDVSASGAQRKVYWGVEPWNVAGPGTTDALFYQAESLGADAATTAVGSAGASGSGSNVLKNTALTTGFVRQFTTQGGFGNMTHVGGFRVFARVWCPATNAGTVQVRFDWLAPQTGQTFIPNDTVTYDPTWEGSWRLLDLGAIQVREPFDSLSAHLWVGQVYAKSTSAGDDIEFDHIFFVPTTHASGEATGTAANPVASSTFIVTHDAAVTVHPLFGHYAPPVRYEGDYLRLPVGPTGLRFVVKLSRGDDTTADSSIDDTAAELTYWPRYLVVPDA